MGSSPIKQWGRVCQVTVGTGGQGIEVSALRITFQVEETIRHTPNQASILLYNLHPDDEAKIKEQYKDVILKVGYAGPFGGQAGLFTLFSGNIRRAFTYRDTNDWITEIQAADGDKAYRNAVVNATLAAGSTADDVVAVAAESMRQAGGTKLGTSTTAAGGLIRGKVITGAARDVLHDVAGAANAHWSIQRGELQIVPAASVLPGEAVVITAETGMVGAPEISDKGVQVKCLLNPQLRPNGAVWLNNNDIKIKVLQQSVSAPKQKAKGLVRLAPDGIYKAYKLRSEGDTRGTEWYTTADCIRIGDAIPSTSSGRPTPKINFLEGEDVGG